MSPTPSSSSDPTTPKKDDYLDPYREALQAHGASFDTMLWKSRATQTIRFDVLLSMVKLTGMCILDAGCGLGDLSSHLNHAGVEFRQYVGIDGLPRMVEKAMARDLPRSEFLAVDFVADPSVFKTKHPDVIFFSGSLNTLNEENARRIVRAAFDTATSAVVFNFLSDKCNEAMKKANTGPANRFNTIDWIDWALSLSTNVIFRQDYLAGHDATIAIFKTARDGT